jgi:hypothetical protein
MQWYHFVMNDRRNPLRHLAPPQRFQAMAILGSMWTTIFCTAFGVWFFYGELVAVQLLLALGTLITGSTFQQAHRLAIYRDQRRPDGTPRYDDVWGA